MGSKVSRTDFTWIADDEPHATRRRLILQKHPEVKNLMRVDRTFKWIVTCMVIFQTLVLYLIQSLDSYFLLFLIAYFVYGVVSHSLTLAIHEISHGQAFGPNHVLANKLFGMFANLPIGIPVFMGFKVYHADHHRYLGVDMLDPDLPTDLETKLFRTPLTKLVFLTFQGLFYTLRPLRRPKPQTLFDLLNIAVQLIFNVVIGLIFGWWTVGFMILSTILAVGIHPMTGHFLSEHYILHSDKEYFELLQVSQSKNPNLSDPSSQRSLVPQTYSYYGSLNWITFNVGYHVEHHDFPSIPARNLPLLKKAAPEFYDNLYYHKSWVRCLYRYVMDPNCGPLARTKIPYEEAANK